MYITSCCNGSPFEDGNVLSKYVKYQCLCVLNVLAQQVGVAVSLLTEFSNVPF